MIWIYAKSGTEIDGAILQKFEGTKAQAKSALRKCIREDADMLQSEGEIIINMTESVKDIEERCYDGSLYGTICCDGFHMDYVMYPQEKLSSM